MEQVFSFFVLEKIETDRHIWLIESSRFQLLENK